MKFDCTTLLDAFKLREVLEDSERSHLYAFILSTSSTNLKELLPYYNELNALSSYYFLIIQPSIDWSEYELGPVDRDNIVKVLSRYASHSEYRDIKSIVEDFITKQDREVYSFCDELEIAVNNIPSIVFFSSLEQPEEYILWPIEKLNGEAIMREFRFLVAKLKEKYGDFYDRLKEYRKVDDKIKQANLRDEDLEQQKEEILKLLREERANQKAVDYLVSLRRRQFLKKAIKVATTPVWKKFSTPAT
ncbi:MAG: hypothetical protein ACFFD4_27400 [Candidatus Odinarchaeota archaeon]